MNILVTGANGLLGFEVVNTLESSGHEVVATDVAEGFDHLDITEPLAISDMLSTVRPQWLVNCAAYTKVDDCEENTERAFLLNGRAPGLLARACEEHQASLLHISSDYVFDGMKDEPYSEDDKTNPLSVYGKSKLSGEVAVQEYMERFVIIRPQWLFGPHGPNFVDTILNKAKKGETLRVVNDQRGSPTYSKDLAKAIRYLIECNAQGIFHVCNRGSATWFDLAKKAVELSGLDTEVIPVGTESFPRPAKRPASSVLSTKRFSELTQRVMPPWQISLKDYIKIKGVGFEQG